MYINFVYGNKVVSANGMLYCELHLLSFPQGGRYSMSTVTFIPKSFLLETFTYNSNGQKLYLAVFPCRLRTPTATSKTGNCCCAFVLDSGFGSVDMFGLKSQD